MIWHDVIFEKEDYTTDELNNVLPAGTFTTIAETICRQHFPEDPERTEVNERMTKKKDEMAFKVRSSINIETATHFSTNGKRYKIYKLEDLYPRWWIVYGVNYA